MELPEIIGTITSGDMFIGVGIVFGCFLISQAIRDLTK